MNFNSEMSKQVQKVILLVRPSNFLNNKLVQSSQKHFGLILDTSLTFDGPIKAINLKLIKPLACCEK